MQWSCGFVKARAGLGISPDFMQMNGARRAVGGAQIQLVHGSPRQAPAAAREASRTFLVVESAGRPDAVADRAYVVQLERRRRMSASEVGASTRRVTVHFSWLGRWEEAQECIPEGARKIPMGYVCVNQPGQKFTQKRWGGDPQPRRRLALASGSVKTDVMPHTVREKAKLLNRARRHRGQIEALERALSEEDECSAILHQIVAARGAINGLLTQVIEGVIREHLARKVHFAVHKRANFGCG